MTVSTCAIAITSWRTDIGLQSIFRGLCQWHCLRRPGPHVLPCGLQVADQLDAIPFLCRFQYARTAEYLLRFLDPLVAAYTEAATPGALPRKQCARRLASASRSIENHSSVYAELHEK